MEEKDIDTERVFCYNGYKIQVAQYGITAEEE